MLKEVGVVSEVSAEPLGLMSEHRCVCQDRTTQVGNTTSEVPVTAPSGRVGRPNMVRTVGHRHSVKKRFFHSAGKNTNLLVDVLAQQQFM